MSETVVYAGTVEALPDMPSTGIGGPAVTVACGVIDADPEVLRCGVRCDVCAVDVGVIDAAPEVLNVTVTTRKSGNVLLWKHSGSEILSFGLFGTIAGVTPLAANGIHGGGAGTLEAYGPLLRWQAPGSAAFGAPVDVSAGGTFYLLDGADPDKWLRVSVTPAALASGPAGARVALQDTFGNGLADSDISAAQAAAGNVATRTLTLANQTAATLANVTVWLDPAHAAEYAISWDNVSFFSPTNEAQAIAGLGYQNIAGGGTRSLYLKRTIAAGAGAAAAKIVALTASFDDGEGGRARSGARGMYRIANATGYRFYRHPTRLPQPGSDAPFATNATLPHSPATTFADGDWFVGATYFNGYLESGLLTIKRLRISGGASQPLRPDEARNFLLTQIAGGVPRIEAWYWPQGDDVDGDGAADAWAVWYTTDGSAPGSGAPQMVLPMERREDAGLAVLRYNLPAQANGTVVRVLVKPQRTINVGAGGNVYSASGQAATLTIATAAPSAPAGGGAARGRIGSR